MKIQQLPDFWRLSAVLRAQILAISDPLEQISTLEGFIAEPGVAGVLHDLLTQERKEQMKQKWDPYAWHDGKPGKPRWRVRTGMAEERERLCKEFDELNQAMEGDFDLRSTIANHNEWDRLKQAILDCEEEESA